MTLYFEPSEIIQHR